MRTSIFAFILIGTLAFCVLGFGLSYSQARLSITAFAEQERLHRSHQRLDQLERSAEIWVSRQLSRVRDLGTHSILIQGVMQPERRLRELRRFLDHVKWDGEEVQLTVLDFEARPLYRRFEEPVADFTHDDRIASLLSGSRERFALVHVEQDRAWISVGTPIGRPGYPEGVVLATLPLASLSRVLQTGPLDGLELRVGDTLLERRGDATGGERVIVGESGLAIHFRPDLAHLDAALGSLERSLAMDLMLTAAAALLLLPLTMRMFVAAPLRRLVTAIEGIDPDDPDQRVSARHPFQELSRLSRAFNHLLTRLGDSRRKLIDANQMLEVRVEQRTTELAARNRDLEQFAYVASHDLREPLRKIASFSQLLEAEHADELDDEGRQYLDIVANAAMRMSRLIQDLLEFSRIGRVERDFEPVDLNEIVRRVRDDLSQVELDSGARVRVDELPWVVGTPRYLMQLYQNLLSNAYKFSGEEPPEVHVGIESVELEEGRCVLFVRDHGIGIDPKYSEKVFRMFERLHGREQYGGTGIGLPICLRVMEELDGRLWLESTEGTGCTFYFSLPLAVDPEKEERQR